MELDNLTLRVGRHCDLPNAWTTESENETVWHGYFDFILREFQEKIPAKFEFVNAGLNNDSLVQSKHQNNSSK